MLTSPQRDRLWQKAVKDKDTGLEARTLTNCMILDKSPSSPFTDLLPDVDEAVDIRGPACLLRKSSWSRERTGTENAPAHSSNSRLQRSITVLLQRLRLVRLWEKEKTRPGQEAEG